MEAIHEDTILRPASHTSTTQPEAPSVSVGCHTSRACQPSRHLLQLLLVGAIQCVAWMSVCHSNNSNSRPIPNMKDMLRIRACTTTWMTCAAMSKLYLRAGFHSHFTSHLGIVATLHRLILLQQPPRRHHWAKVIGRVLHECE